MSITKAAEWSNFSPSGAASTIVVTITSTVPVGDHLVVMGIVSATDRAATVTDSKGNTYTTHKDYTRVGGTPVLSLSLASCKVTTQLVNTDTVTITFSGATAGGRIGKVVQYNGMKQTGWFDQVSAGGGTSTSTGTQPIDGLTTATDNELGLAIIAVESAFVFNSVPSGWTNETGATSGTTVRTLDWASKILTPAGSTGALSFGISGAAFTSSFSAAFNPEPDAAPATPKAPIRLGRRGSRGAIRLGLRG